MVDIPPPEPRGRGANVVMLLVLVCLIAGLAGWAFLRNPPGAPSPTATALPEAVPGGGGNTTPR